MVPSARGSVGLAAVAAVVALAAGCGGSAPRSGSGAMGGNGMGGAMMGSATTVPASAAAAEALFRTAGCGGCHTLAAAGTDGTAGPNLDDAQASYDLTLERIRSGGSGMPAFSGTLSAAQIRELAHFVANASG